MPPCREGSGLGRGCVYKHGQLDIVFGEEGLSLNELEMMVQAYMSCAILDWRGKRDGAAACGAIVWRMPGLGFYAD